MGKLKAKYQNFDKETGKATFVYSYGSYLFEGEAQCHEDDADMSSELVGLKYAETRAFYQYLKVRRGELQLRLSTLEGMLNNMITSKDFDITTKYGKKMQVAICETRMELKDCRDGLENIPQYLKDDISARDGMYKKIREKRKNKDA